MDQAITPQLDLHATTVEDLAASATTCNSPRGIFRSVRIAALVCMPSTHTSGVGRVAGETVAATRKTCCYASASSGLTKSVESSRATGSLVMCPLAVLTPSRIASL